MNFAERYRPMSETELMNLAREYDGLVDEAQAALRAEFARRGLEPPLIEEDEAPIAGDDPGLVTVARYRDMPEAIVARAAVCCWPSLISKLQFFFRTSQLIFVLSNTACPGKISTTAIHPPFTAASVRQYFFRSK